MKLKSVVAIIMVLAIVFSMAACTANTPAPTAPSTEAPTQDVAPTETEPVVESHYPVTITTYDYEGNEITTTYEKAPEKVIAVYQGCIETMIVLGLEDRVIASYGLDNPVKPEWEEALSKMNYNEDVFAPDKETVTMLEPDLIFSWGSLFSDKNLGDQKEWIQNGTNTYISSNTKRNHNGRTIENECTDLLNMGKIFDCEEKAQALVDEMMAEIANVQEKTKGQESPKVAVIEFLGDNISNYGAKQLGGNMVEALGGTLADAEASSFGKEDIVNLDPDVIFVVYMARTENVEAEMIAKVMEDPAFADLSAVANGRVYSVMLGDMYASTVRTIDGIRVFAAGMYPELYN